VSPTTIKRPCCPSFAQSIHATGILFVEGFETTGHSISWTLLNVATEPGERLCVHGLVRTEQIHMASYLSETTQHYLVAQALGGGSQPLALLAPSSILTPPFLTSHAGTLVPPTHTPHPAGVQDAIAAELDSLGLLAKPHQAPRPVGLDDLPRLKYLSATIKEVRGSFPHDR